LKTGRFVFGFQLSPSKRFKSLRFRKTARWLEIFEILDNKLNIISNLRTKKVENPQRNNQLIL